MSQLPLQLFPVSSTEGINIASKDRTISYLYGISDFWMTVFKDQEVVNTLLKANSVQASDIYNRFLQLTSGICLEDIQSQLNFQTRLVFLSSQNLVSGTLATYHLPDNITFSRYVVDQPLLPRSYLEQEIDYFIDPDLKTISFAKPLSAQKFIYKRTSSVVTYALWFMDSKVENDLLIDQYSSMVNISRPTFVSDTFKNFLYGIYFLYTQGPTLEIIKRGINLVLEVPISLQDEQVIDIRIYDETNEYLVITNQNTYRIPNGIPPLVAAGDFLIQGQELGSWVDIKDYLHDGDWWLNISIPDKIMPHVPEGQTRFATLGSYAYSLMANYLKNHTFLVNIKTTNFENLQTYAQITDILQTIKPSYTYPIYIWTVPLEEVLTLDDGNFSMSYGHPFCEKLTNGIARFRRDSNNPIHRTCPSFTRFSGPGLLDDLLGNNSQLNGISQTVVVVEDTHDSTETITGFINQFAAMRANTTYIENWFNLFTGRNNQYYRPPMTMAFRTTGTTGLPVSNFGYDYLASLYSPTHRVLRLFTTTRADVLTTYSGLGITSGVVDSANFTFTTGAVGSTLRSSFSTLMLPNANRHFNFAMPRDSWNSYAPLSTDILNSDSLLFVKMFEDIIAVYWVTTNATINPPAYIPNYETDALTTKIVGTRTRGQGIVGQPTYMSRAYPYPLTDTGHACMIDYSDLENTDVGIDRNDARNPTLTFTRSWN